VDVVAPIVTEIRRHLCKNAGLKQMVKYLKTQHSEGNPLSFRLGPGLSLEASMLV
jgi:hypothetical protein